MKKDIPTLFAVLIFILCLFFSFLQKLFVIAIFLLVFGSLAGFIFFMIKSAKMFYKVEIKKEVFPESTDISKPNTDDSKQINEDYDDLPVLNQEKKLFQINRKSDLNENQNEFNYAIIKIYDLITKITDAKYQNKKLIEKYIEHVEHIRNLKTQIKELSCSINEIKSKARICARNIKDIHECKGKPLLMLNEKFIKQKRPEIEKNQEEIMKLKKEATLLQEQIDRLQTQIETEFFVIDEKNDNIFKMLKEAFDKFKDSKLIKGDINIEDCSIDNHQKNLDLQYLLYDIEPYCIKIKSKRYYIFPESIWVFEGKNKLFNIYNTNVLSANFDYKEEKYSYILDKNEIKEDTKIIIKEIPYDTWLHTCVDGSPDMRYKHNPIRVCYKQEEYYLKCKFELILCDNSLLFDVSSYDNCKLLKNAIDDYNCYGKDN